MAVRYRYLNAHFASGFGRRVDLGMQQGPGPLYPGSSYFVRVSLFYKDTENIYFYIAILKSQIIATIARTGQREDMWA